MALKDVVESLKNFDMDQLNDLNSVGSWPLAVKLIMWVLAFVGALTAGYFFHVTNLQTGLAKTEAQQSVLRDDYRQKYFEAEQLDAYRQQQLEMEKSFEAILRKLPSDTEIPGLIEDITLVGLRNGLSFTSIDLQPEEQHEFYIEKPIKIIVSGSYHDLGSFVSDVADLSRIVTLHDFSMSPVRSRNAQRNIEVTGGLIQMSITAKTYRYNDERG